MKRPGLFTLWFGWGLPPVLAGALAISFVESWPLGVAASAVFLAWFYETGRTTCSRCAYHGTSKCGLPGLIAPMLTPKKSSDSLSSERIRNHMHLDLWVLLFLNGLYALQPWALPVSVIWSIGVWHISLGPKRHHGLLYRLREPQIRPVVNQTIPIQVAMFVTRNRPPDRLSSAHNRRRLPFWITRLVRPEWFVRWFVTLAAAAYLCKALLTARAQV